MADVFAVLTNSNLDITTVLIFFLVFLVSVIWMIRPKSELPGPPAWPIFGNILTKEGFLGKSVFDNEEIPLMFQKYGPIFRRFMGPYEYVYVGGYSTVLQVLKKTDDFVDRPNWVPGIRIGKRENGLVWSNGEEWKSVRRFTLRTFRDFGVGKKSIEQKILDEAHELVDQFQKSNGAPVANCKQMMMRASCNIIHSIVFGFRCKHEDKEFNDLIQAFDDIFSGAGPLSISTMFRIVIYFNMLFGRGRTKRFLMSRKYINQYVFKQTEEHKKTYDENDIRDFVDVYIQSEKAEGKKYSENTLFTTITDMFAAGTDTTATTLHWALLYMIQYPDIQKNCQDEILKVIGSGRDVVSSDKLSLPYVEATLLEVQRKANTAVGTLPRMAVRDTTINGYHVKKGTILLASLCSVHYDETIWKNPRDFDPSRFLNSDGKVINREMIMPFSTGSRNCAGEGMAKTELFLIFTNFLQRLTFSKVDPDEELSFQGTVGITHSAPNYRLKASVR